MNRKTTLFLFAALITLAIVAFVYYKNTYFPKYKWDPDYKKTSDQPYGLKLFYNVIKAQDQKTTVITDQDYRVLDTTLTNSNFITITNDFYVDSAYAEVLIRYAEKGNRVFIASNYCPMEIITKFVPRGDSVEGFREKNYAVIQLDFTKTDAPFAEKLKFHYQVLKDTASYNWSIYRKPYFEDTLKNFHFIPLSFLNDSSVNAFYIPCGKGRIIIHANPVLFTNYYMVRQNGFKHANNFLAQLHKGPVYWDEPAFNSDGNTNTNHSNKNNPLKFLFSHPYLKTAWYLFLGTILLYLVFRSKREQRIIPLMPVNTNASIEFTKAIGTLYFQSKGHNTIANEIYIIFLAEIRARYNISTDVPEPELIEQLATRSGIEKTVLYHLFKQFKFVRTDADASADDLINLYNTIENYHKKRK